MTRIERKGGQVKRNVFSPDMIAILVNVGVRTWSGIMTRDRLISLFSRCESNFFDCSEQMQITGE